MYSSLIKLLWALFGVDICLSPVNPTNPKVADLADAFATAVLQMIKQAVKAAHQVGIPVI